MKYHRSIVYLIAFLLFILTACHITSDNQLDYQDFTTLPSQTVEEPSTQPDIVEETTNPSIPVDMIRPKPTIRPTEPPKVYPNYYGRLHIPEAGINVALYYGADQSITDRKDSANIFSMSVFDGLYIADHKTQAFKKLHKIQPGTKGYIELASEEILHIECVDIFEGYNTGKLITDKDGQTNFQANYAIYTCKKGWQNIVICLWNKCEL